MTTEDLEELKKDIGFLIKDWENVETYTLEGCEGDQGYYVTFTIKLGHYEGKWYLKNTDYLNSFVEVFDSEKEAREAATEIALVKDCGLPINLNESYDEPEWFNDFSS